MDAARTLIERLALSEHPEGGWYRETWRAPPAPGADSDARAAGTAILFLLAPGQRSHWHRVDATEIWFWHAGAPLRLSTAADGDGAVVETLLGPDVAAGQAPQHVIPPDHWQAAAPLDGGWTLVSCTVTPAFEFAGFTLAPPDWSPGIPADG